MQLVEGSAVSDSFYSGSLLDNQIEQAKTKQTKWDSEFTNYIYIYVCY